MILERYINSRCREPNSERIEDPPDAQPQFLLLPLKYRDFMLDVGNQTLILLMPSPKLDREILHYTRIRPVLVKNMIILASYVNKWTFI